MISYRLRGLITLHVITSASLMTTYFLALALSVPYLRFLSLSPDVNLLVYAIPTALGMALSGRFLAPFGPRFHVIGWLDALDVSTRQIIVITLLVFALIVGTKDQAISRLFIASYLVSGWALLVVLNRKLPRFLAQLVFQRSRRIPTLLVGAASAVARLRPWLRQKEHLGIHVVGIVSGDADGSKLVAGLPCFGGYDDLKGVMEGRNIGQVVVLELPAEERLRQIVETCQRTGARLLVYQNTWDWLPVPMVPVVEDQHLFLTLHEEPLEDPINRGLKRLFDLGISLPVVVLVLPPLCLFVWVVQQFQSPGPLMFRRPRGGQRGRSFQMLKFRSMHVASYDPKLESRQARQGDPRIYPFGHVLRKTSLDEFPQFVNVLLGDMSIVGPRPHLSKHDVEFSTVAKTYRTRQLVKPGITGLAQVSGLRGEITETRLLQERVRLDIEYITTWSIWLDLQITLATFWQIFRPPPSAR